MRGARPFCTCARLKVRDVLSTTWGAQANRISHSRRVYLAARNNRCHSRKGHEVGKIDRDTDHEFACTAEPPVAASAPRFAWHAPFTSNWYAAAIGVISSPRRGAVNCSRHRPPFYVLEMLTAPPVRKQDVYQSSHGSCYECVPPLRPHEAAADYRLMPPFLADYVIFAA